MRAHMSCLAADADVVLLRRCGQARVLAPAQLPLGQQLVQRRRLGADELSQLNAQPHHRHHHGESNRRKHFTRPEGARKHWGGERCEGQLLRSCENKTFLVAKLYSNSDTDWCLLVDGRRDDDAVD